MSRSLRQWTVLGLFSAAFALPGTAGAAPGDGDNDTVADALDNCPVTYNIEQGDFDADGAGNACDATPGVAAGQSFTIVYHRDVTTGGPLSADPAGARCASSSFIAYENGVQVGPTIFNCYRRFTTGLLFNPNQTIQVTLLTAPAGCRAMYTSPITIAYNGGGSFTAINAYYLCDEGLLLEQLLVASTGVGPGSSLPDKIAAAQASFVSGDLATTCSILGAYVNQVRAQSGKKLSAATAASLIARAQAITNEIGC